MKKTKKILSLVLSIAMLCTMFTAFGLTASAAGETPIEISDFATLKSTVEGATAEATLEIDIKADITGGSYIYINNGKNITINLNSHTVQCYFKSSSGAASTLTIHGKGTVKGPDGKYGEACADFRNGSTLIANNVKFLGGTATSENCYGYYGLSIIDSTVKLDNCYVSGGKSNGTADNLSAIASSGTTKVYAKNCTFVRGSGGSGSNYYTVQNIVYNLDTGEKIEIADINQSPIVIGKGYTDIVTGNVIKDTDGSPAKAETPVTATATIPSPTYTVTIPANVDLGSVKGALEKYRSAETDRAGEKIIVEKSFSISASGVDNLFDGKTLAVSIGTTGTETTLTGGGNTVPCKLNKGTTAYTEGAEFASFTNDVDLAIGEKNEQSGAIVINRCDITKSADYTGTLTFNIEIKEGI